MEKPEQILTIMGIPRTLTKPDTLGHFYRKLNL